VRESFIYMDFILYDMIDIKLIRENPDIVKENIKKKFQDSKLPLVDEVSDLDKEFRKLKGENDNLRHQRNKLSEEINKTKKSGGDVAQLLKEVKEIPEHIKKNDERLAELEKKLHDGLAQIPNIMHEDVPIGKDSTQNVDKEHFGHYKFMDFEPKNHVELAENLDIVDFESSRRTSGNGFYYLQGGLALLNQALIRFGVDKMVSKGFTYVETPLMLNDSVIRNVTDLNDMTNQIFKIQDEELYLIGTSEHSLIGRHINAVIPENKLPVKHTSYSMCFRKEIGSHGIDEKGLYRTHQFNKIEMIVICKPDDSMKHFEELKSITVELFKDLDIPIRVLEICSGDLGDLKHCQVDIEAWSPKRKEYYEIGSCSNLTEAQARRLNIRYANPAGERFVPHTLNNTAIATSRAMVAILENYQNADGSITIPKVLLPYMHGIKKIEIHG
jgi:seryl-tRNA synthetase